jgi:hypothetical protein
MVNRYMFDLFHNINVSLRHTKVSTPAAGWGLAFCLAQGHGYHCKNIEHAAVHHGLTRFNLLIQPPRRRYTLGALSLLAVRRRRVAARFE